MNKILPVCISILLAASAAGWAASPTAVDIEVLDDESSVYVLYSDGYLQTTGFAVSFGYPANIDAIDLVFTSAKLGYYILEKDGTIHQYGDAVDIGDPGIDTKVSYVDMELFQATNSPYFLKEDGSIITVGEAKLYGELLRNEKAADLELTEDGLGYYVLYEDGTIAFFGTAINRGFTDTGNVKAVDLELDGNGYYVILEDGNILTFGDALYMPFQTRPSDDVVDMVLTPQGYRVLDEGGEVHDFIRVDAQGTSNWYAKVSARSVPQQATPTPVPTPTPTRTPQPSVNYFNISESGFAEKIVGMIPEGVSLPASLDSGYTSLFGGGLFIAASDDDGQTARKILHYSLEDATGRSATGTVFAALVPERGAAVIRGLSYSHAGLYVVVSDDPGTFVFLIEGNFEESGVSGASLF